VDTFVYVSSLRTITHLAPLFVALDRNRPGVTGWHLTVDRPQAHGFTLLWHAAQAANELRGNGHPNPRVRAFHLKDPDRLWHVAICAERARVDGHSIQGSGRFLGPWGC
jgi:hypothetical protein